MSLPPSLLNHFRDTEMPNDAAVTEVVQTVRYIAVAAKKTVPLSLTDAQRV